MTSVPSLLIADDTVPSGWLTNRLLLGLMIGTASMPFLSRSPITSVTSLGSIGTPNFLANFAASLFLSLEFAMTVIIGILCSKEPARRKNSSAAYNEAATEKERIAMFIFQDGLNLSEPNNSAASTAGIP